MAHMIGVSAAAQAQRVQADEEERMTGYASDDLEGWEFKIVRSSTGQFGNPEVLRSLREDEAASGWELLEKFDDSRVRFKRRVEERERDGMREPGVDPYRTQYGWSEARLAFTVIGLVAALMIVGGYLVWLFGG